MRVFVAGATGVIGRRVVPRLLAAGHRVTAMARTPAKRTSLERMGAGASPADLFDPGALHAAVSAHDAVINLATSVPPSSRAFLPGAWRENDRIRRIGSVNLGEAAVVGGAKRFIQESFAPIYPDSGDAWIDEGTPVRPARYNRSTLEAEAVAEGFTRQGGAGIVLRFANFYGPDSGYTLDTIRLVRKGWAATLGTAEGFISSVSHDDAAEAVMAVLDAPAGAYNVVDDEPLRRRDYFNSLAEALRVAPPRIPPGWLRYLAGSLGESVARSQRVSNRKLRTQTGWAPRYRSAREGWQAILADIARDSHGAG